VSVCHCSSGFDGNTYTACSWGIKTTYKLYNMSHCWPGYPALKNYLFCVGPDGGTGYDNSVTQTSIFNCSAERMIYQNYGLVAYDQSNIILNQGGRYLCFFYRATCTFGDCCFVSNSHTTIGDPPTFSNCHFCGNGFTRDVNCTSADQYLHLRFLVCSRGTSNFSSKEGLMSEILFFCLLFYPFCFINWG